MNVQHASVKMIAKYEMPCATKPEIFVCEQHPLLTVTFRNSTSFSQFFVNYSNYNLRKKTSCSYICITLLRGLYPVAAHCFCVVHHDFCVVFFLQPFSHFTEIEALAEGHFGVTHVANLRCAASSSLKVVCKVPRLPPGQTEWYQYAFLSLVVSFRCFAQHFT